MDESSLREVMSKWLSNETWNWTSYATLTFRRPMRKDALGMSRVWVRYIARTAPRVWAFCCQETHSDGQRLHVHCLVSYQRNLLSQPSETDLWSWWSRNLGRAQVSPFRSAAPKSSKRTKKKWPSGADLAKSDGVEAVAYYLTKYVTKEAWNGGFDWDFYAYLNGKSLAPNEMSCYFGVNTQLPTV